MIISTLLNLKYIRKLEINYQNYFNICCGNRSLICRKVWRSISRRIPTRIRVHRKNYKNL